jgi:hypothetical protein
MPVITLTLDETSKSITSSIHRQLVEDLVTQIGVGFSTLVTVHNGVELNRTDNDSNASVKGKPNLPFTISGRRVTARITNLYDEDSITSTAVSQKETLVIYKDHSVDTSMYPIYIKSDTTINLEYTCPSRTEAARLQDDIRIRLSQSRNILHHEVEYNIILPQVAEDFITDVYDLKNRLVPCDLGAYFRRYTTNRMHVMTDLTGGENARVAVRERQVRVVGAFDFGSLPDPYETDNDTNTYKVTFPYKLKLDIPRGLCLSYPPMICNRPMPRKYLAFVQEAKVKTRQEYSRNLTYSHSLSALSHFEANRQLSYRIQENLPLNLPLFDDFPLRKGHAGYVILVSFLVGVDETDKRGLLNLREVDTDFCLSPEFVEFLAQGERTWIAQPYLSPFFLGLHQKDKHYDNNNLLVDSDLNVSAKTDVSLLKAVRVTLSICLDVTRLDSSAILRLYGNKNLALFYISELIRAINNYKPEYVSMGVADASFADFIIRLIYDAYLKKQEDFLRELFLILGGDPRISNLIASMLHNNYSFLYNYLTIRTNVAELRGNTRHSKDFSKNNNHAMRSVMTTYVESARMKTYKDRGTEGTTRFDVVGPL